VLAACRIASARNADTQARQTVGRALRRAAAETSALPTPAAAEPVPATWHRHHRVGSWLAGYRERDVSETPKEKTDRQLIELLNEVRVALPGAQVLLGFLLTAPLATRFAHTSELDRVLLYLCTVVTAAGVLLLMAPSVYHRIRWDEGGKQDVVAVGHQFFLVGTSCLALGLLFAVFVIAELIIGTVAAVCATAIVLSVGLSTWYLLPLRRSRRASIRAEE
jgi:hypothetical protein